MSSAGVVAILLLLLAAGMAWAWYRQFLVNGRHLIRIGILEQQLNSVVSERDLGRSMHNSIVGLPHGAVLGDFELPVLDSSGTMTRTEWRGRPLFLVYVAPDDPHSVALLRDLASLPMSGEGDTPSTVVVSTGSEDSNRDLVAQTGILFPVLLQEGSEAALVAQVSSTPSAYFITPDDVVAGGLAVGHAAVLALARAALAGGVSARGAIDDFTPLPSENLPSPGELAEAALAIGTVAPDFTLPSLGGDPVRLSDFRGAPLLLVFSQPDCPPCDTLAPALAELARTQLVPKVAMIGRGDEDANRAKVQRYGFTFPVAVQRDWELSRAYGVVAAPSAYLIDSEGRVASHLAVGAEPVLMLGRTGQIPDGYRNGVAMEYSERVQ